MVSVGAVSVRSARWPRERAPAATASARYTLYEPLCVPITLRCARALVVPTTGPRSAGSAAPQRIAGAPVPPACEVRRMCPGAGLSGDMAGSSKGRL